MEVDIQSEASSDYSYVSEESDSATLGCTTSWTCETVTTNPSTDLESAETWNDEFMDSFHETDLNTSCSSHESNNAVDRMPIESQPIYDGSLLTKFDSQLLLLQYAIRHSLSKQAFSELIQLLKVHLPKLATLPSSVYALKRCFIEMFPELRTISHAYCSKCHRPLQLEELVCRAQHCSGRANEFISTNIGLQIKRKLEGM